MMVLPTQFSIPSVGQDLLKLGTVRKLNTERPELAISVNGGTLIFPGKFEHNSTTFLSIQCKAKGNQVTCSDMFDTTLIFGQVL